MITLYGFGRIFRQGIGETKDLRIEWALQETGLPYRVHASTIPRASLTARPIARSARFIRRR